MRRPRRKPGFLRKARHMADPPGREVTSCHTLSSWLPSLAWQGVNPERTVRQGAFANPTQAFANRTQALSSPFS